jgi:hypothetical protein
MTTSLSSACTACSFGHALHPAGGSRRQWDIGAAIAEATADTADSDHQPDKSEDTREEATSAGVQAPASVWLPYKTASEKKV